MHSFKADSPQRHETTTTAPWPSVSQSLSE